MISDSRLQRYREDPAAFRADLLIDADGEPTPFQPDPWQADDFAAMDPAWRRVAGHKVDVDHQRFYLERPRGHSKTSDIAVCVTWAAVFAERPLSGFVAAADKDQAALVREAVTKLVRANPWLATFLEIQNWLIKNPHTGTEVKTLAKDVGSSFGINPGFIVCDEISEWDANAGRELWISLLSSAAKRANCVFAAIGNAGRGRGTSWQWKARERCRESEDWHFNSLDGPQASWIPQSRIDAQRADIPSLKAFNRLWMNEWQSGEGDALDWSDVEACVTRDGPVRVTEPGLNYVAGLDLGIKSDHSGFVILGIDRHAAKLVLIDCMGWAPPPGGKVSLAEVRDAIISADRRYGFDGVIHDGYPAQLFLEELEAWGVNMVEYPPSTPNVNRMAREMVQIFSNRQIALYRDEALLRDLSKMNIKEKSYGFRLDAPRGEHGHADRAAALATALPLTIEWLDKLRSAPVDDYSEPGVEYISFDDPQGSDSRIPDRYDHSDLRTFII